MKLLLKLFLCFLPLGLFAQDYITKNMSTGRSYLAPAVFENQILLAGGNFKRTVDYFDIETCTLESAEYGSDGFSNAKVASNENYAMFYDLSGVNLSIRSFYAYEHATKTWYDGDLPIGTSTSMFGGYFVGDVLHLFNEDNPQSVYQYDFTSRTWTVEASPVTLTEPVIFETEDKIFFLGNRPTFTSWTNEASVLNKATGVVDTFSLTQARNEMAVVQYEDKLVVAGGSGSPVNTNTSVDLIEIIDINDYSIETLQMSKKKNDVVGVRVGERVVFAGGYGKTADVVDMNTMTVESTDLEAQFNLRFLQGGVTGNYAIFAGGNSSDGNIIYTYHAEENQWDTIQVNGSREGARVVTLDNKVLVVGGEDDDTDIDYDEILIFEDLIDGVKFPSLDYEFSLYPNPSSDALSVREIETNLFNHLEIFSLKGRLLSKTAFNKEQSIDISNLAKGQYIIRLSNAQGFVSKVFQKQ